MRDPEDEVFFKKKKAQVIQLERAGNVITMRIANPGEPLQLVGSHEMIDLPEEALAGIFICSHEPELVDEAKVWNVRIDQPVATNYNPGKDGLSRLPARASRCNNRGAKDHSRSQRSLRSSETGCPMEKIFCSTRTVASLRSQPTEAHQKSSTQEQSTATTTTTVYHSTGRCLQ